MTYPSTSNHPPRQQKRWLLPTITAAAGLLVGGLGMTGISMATAETTTGSTSSCVTAINQADELIDMYSQGFTDASDSLGHYMDGNYTAMDASTANLENLAIDLAPALESYYTTANNCIN